CHRQGHRRPPCRGHCSRKPSGRRGGAPDHLAGKQRPRPQGRRHVKILVIEDDRRIAAFLKRGLTAEGYQVSVERDGRDGLERLRNETFELVILDRMLPYIDGMEVSRILREERRPVYVLMLTAKDALQDKVDGLRAGADDYLTKPF